MSQYILTPAYRDYETPLDVLKAYRGGKDFHMQATPEGPHFGRSLCSCRDIPAGQPVNIRYKGLAEVLVINRDGEAVNNGVEETYKAWEEEQKAKVLHANHNHTKMSKLDILCDIAGGSSDDLESLSDTIMDSVQPGICMNHECEYTTDVEPDCQNGYCEECGTQSVKSLSVLLGLM